MKLFALLLLAVSPLFAHSDRHLKVNDSSLAQAMKVGIEILPRFSNPAQFHWPNIWAWGADRKALLNLLKFPIVPSKRKPLSVIQFDRIIVSNVTGRALAALIHMKKAGTESHEALEKLQANYALLLKDAFKANASGLPLDPSVDGKREFKLFWHYNFGGALKGLTALVEQGDEEAKILYEKLLTSLLTHYVGPKKDFSWERVRKKFNLSGGNQWRKIEKNWSAKNYDSQLDPWVSIALLDYEQVTKSPQALAFLKAIATRRLESFFKGNRVEDIGHGYEIAGRLNALSKYALRTDDKELLDRVKKSFQILITEGVISQTGWMTETYSDAVEEFGALREKLYSDTGEINNTAELALASLNLGDSGDTDYYSLAEKIVRGHLLPSQLIDPDDWIDKLPGRAQDWVSLRTFKGAFGFPAPYGPIPDKMPYMVTGFHHDVIVGALDAIAEIYSRAHRQIGTQAYVNLLFSVESDLLQVKDPYRNRGEIYLRAKNSFTDLYIRVPERGSFDLDREDLKPYEPNLDGKYLHLKNVKPNDRIAIAMKFDSGTTTEEINGRRLTTEWRGERVAKMSAPEAAPLLFFPEWEKEN